MSKTLVEKIWDAHVVKREEGFPDIIYIDTDKKYFLFFEGGLCRYDYKLHGEELIYPKRITQFDFNITEFAPVIFGDMFFAMAGSGDDDKFIFPNYIYGISLTKWDYDDGEDGKDTETQNNLIMPRLFGKLTEGDQQRWDDLLKQKQKEEDKKKD